MNAFDVLIKFVLPVATALMAGSIMYLFRMRQLYLTLPAVFAYNELTEKGNTFQLAVHNRSRKSEDDIRVELDPAIQYSIIASSNTGISLNKNVLLIPRLPAKSEASVIMLAEGGEFSRRRVSQISSKEHKGSILTDSQSVPANMADNAMKIFGMLIFLAVFTWGETYYAKKQRSKYVDEEKVLVAQLEHLKNEGWSEFESYAVSEFRKSYLDQELPVSVINEDFKNGLYTATISVTNKTALLLHVNSSYFSDDDDIDINCLPTKDIHDLKVEPGQTIQVKISAQLARNKPRKPMTIGFTFFIGKERYIMLVYKRPERS